MPPTTQSDQGIMIAEQSDVLNKRLTAFWRQRFVRKVKRPEEEEKSRRNRERLRLPYLVLAVSLLVSLGATYLFYTSSENKDRVRFENDVTRLDATINNKIRIYISVLKSGRGFIETVKEVNRETFRTYVNSLDLKNNYTGVQGIGYAKRIFSDEGDVLAQRMESEGYTNFKIFPQTSKDDFITILYLEPLNERNRRAIGFDMSSEPNRREAMDKARDTGEPVATRKIFLVQETEEDRQPGFLIYVPVYRDGNTNPQDVEERRRLLDGYIYSPLRTDKFLADVKRAATIEDIAVTIYEDSAAYENILAQTHSYVPDIGDDLKKQTDINIAGKKWVVEYKALPNFIEKSSTGWTLLIFISGLIFSLLLFGMTYLESFARSRSERINSELKKSEKEKALLFEKEQQARKFAEDASRAKDEFISVVSHELRTPLNTIAGWTRILQSENLAPQMKSQALEKIERNLRTQTKLVEELLDFSQIITGKSDLHSKSIEMSSIFEEVLAEVTPQATEKEVRIEISNSLNGQKVYADAERLKKAIENVVRNAIKFTPKSGTIYTEIKTHDENIEVKIRDHGSGINRKFLSQIFEGFSQADSSSTRKFGGLGLGLAIARHIIELHGGSIKAESEGEGKGSVFTITIPVLDGNTARKI